MAALNLPEYYADLAQTTLSSNYTAASGSIVVTTAANLSTTRQFHFMITDQTTGAVKCIGKATALTSSTFTVTMTTDANANSGDFVTITLCAAAEDQIRQDVSQIGTYANLPATAKNGDRYKCTDSIYDFIYASGAWQAFAHGYPATPPGLTSWTSENLTGGTANYTNGNGYMVAGTSGDIASQYVAAPGSTPYSFIVKFRVDTSGIISRIFGGNTPAIATEAGWVLGWRDSAGKYLGMFGFSFNGGPSITLSIATYSAAHGGSGTGITSLASIPCLLNLILGMDYWFKIQNDGTNLNFYVSIDRQNWYKFFGEAITTHLAAATSVFWGSLVSGNGAAICLDDWTQGT